MIGKALDLKRGGDRYIHTAAYGHFGRSDRPDVSAGCRWCCVGLAVCVVFVWLQCLLRGRQPCDQGVLFHCSVKRILAASWPQVSASCSRFPVLQVFTWEKVLPLKDA
jgi:hypothetical protein